MRISVWRLVLDRASVDRGLIRNPCPPSSLSLSLGVSLSRLHAYSYLQNARSLSSIPGPFLRWLTQGYIWIRHHLDESLFLDAEDLFRLLSCRQDRILSQPTEFCNYQVSVNHHQKIYPVIFTVSYQSSVSLSHRSSDVWYILSPRRFERLGRQKEYGSEALVDEIPARREIEKDER